MNEARYFFPELELFQREGKRKLNINDVHQKQTFLLLPPEVNNTLIFSYVCTDTDVEIDALLIKILLFDLQTNKITENEEKKTEMKTRLV